MVGALFPVKHLNSALLTALNPDATGTRVEWIDLLAIGAWGLIGLLVALRFFRWVPRDQDSRSGWLHRRGTRQRPGSLRAA